MGGRGAGRVFAGNLGGGGLNIFFRGRNSHQVLNPANTYVFFSVAYSPRISAEPFPDPLGNRGALRDWSSTGESTPWSNPNP